MNDDFISRLDPSNPEEFLRLLLDHVNEGLDPIDAAAAMLEAIAPGGSKDVTMEYRSALIARGYERIAVALDGVTIRLGRTACGIGYKVRQGSGLDDLNLLDETERQMMTQCIVDVLRAYGLDAFVGEDNHIGFVNNCTNPDHDHGEGRARSLKPDFQRTIDSFVHEMDAEFGPSIPEPGGSRWDRWM